MRVTSLDHLVLTVRDIEATCRWYQGILGMSRVTFAENRVALAFGTQKINLHPATYVPRVPGEFEPKAAHPTPGSADLCFLTDLPMSNILAHLSERGIPVIEGPVQRTGAISPILSVYIRDPDENLVEIATSLPLQD